MDSSALHMIKNYMPEKHLSLTLSQSEILEQQKAVYPREFEEFLQTPYANQPSVTKPILDKLPKNIIEFEEQYSENIEKHLPDDVCSPNRT